MNEITLTLSPQEVQIIATALSRTDPTGMYVGQLIEKIVKQANPPSEVKEVSK